MCAIYLLGIVCYDMPISVSVNLGITARVKLEYATIDSIIKLFGATKVFLHQIGFYPIEHDEHNECFDLGILDLLTGLKNEEEFKKKAANISELRRDNEVVCLRRKRKYVQLHDEKYKQHTFDDDDASKYKKFDANVLFFDFFSLVTNLDANFDNDHNNVSYETDSNVVNFTKRLQERVVFFEQFGVHESQMMIANHSECSM